MTTLNSLTFQPAPLKIDEHGVIRVGDTRITLETLILAFGNGYSAEEIVLKYPTLNLTDVYAVITYYLWNRSEIDSYLEKIQEESNARYEEYEQQYPTKSLRERLLKEKSRRTSKRA
ncbi:MAG: DUF433 domain-containing protein [Fimbriimonadia bacterium]|nr:DUF433 domain-containing protein [Fimbriimonadia bacterium]